MPKIKRSELDIAEKKYRAFVDERDKLNEQARAIVEEKKVLYEQKDRLFDDMNNLKTAKEKIADTLKNHKSKRNEYQKEAKELIDEKRKKSKGLRGDKIDDLESLQKELEYLEMKQQTATMSLDEENKLIDSIRKKFRELGILREEAQKQKVIQKDVRGIDETIDSLFRSADEEHEQVLKLAAEIKGLQEKVVTQVNEIAHVINEIKKKQEDIEKIRSAADEFHKKAVAMREKVVTVKKEKWKEIQEGRRALDEHHRKVRSEFDDQRKLDAAAEAAMQDLLKKGRIEL